MTTTLEGSEGSASRPGRSLTPGKTRYPLYRRLGGPQGRSGQVRKISLPPGFDPRTVQPVASRYTDYATRPTYHTQVSKLSNSRVSNPWPARLCYAARGHICAYFINYKKYTIIQKAGYTTHCNFHTCRPQNSPQ
jgi:hypothetical protein